MLACLGWTLLLVERNTSITMSQKTRAGNPSIRNPVSIQRYDLRLCGAVRDRSLFLAHPTDWDQMFCFQKYTRHLLRLIPSPQDLQQSLSLERNTVCNAEPCFPHDNVVGNRLCDEYKKPALLIVCHMRESFCDCSCKLVNRP